MRRLRRAAAVFMAAMLAVMTAACSVDVNTVNESQLESIAESFATDMQSIAESMAGEVQSAAESMAEDASKTAESVADSTALELAKTVEENLEKKQAAMEAEAAAAAEAGGEAAETEDAPAEKNGEVYILYTSDIHCGVDQGFGLAGLKQIRDQLEKAGYTTLLVDDGDAIQGESIGTVTKGEVIIDLMNDIQYDIAIPGNHEFDYGMERFLELTEKAEFPYISCNFNKEGELVFPPYIIKEAAGMKIAFVGATTPQTLTTSTPKYFQNEEGEYIYGFLQDETGEALYEAVQKAVDDAREEGADYVILMGHLGLDAKAAPWTYADVISHTSGIDAVLDGHSHDTEQIVMKNKDGVDVPRSAVGTKLNSVGYCHITPEKGIQEINIWVWPNKKSAPGLLGIQNSMSIEVQKAEDEANKQLKQVIARSDFELTINDPVEKDANGLPIRMIRRAETNLGDFLADAVKAVSGADVAIINGGGIRKNIEKGDVTYGDIINVYPYGNMLTVIEASGQQILDALEWGARALPDESGGFLQVSGMSYEADSSVESGCRADENSFMSGIEGERRVGNVMIGEEPIDPEKTYTVAGFDYVFLNHGDGMTAFDDAKVLQDRVMLDNQVVLNYITEYLNGEIGEEYADPYGQGRIVIKE